MMIKTSLGETCIKLNCVVINFHYENNVPYKISNLTTSLLSSTRLHEYEKEN
jgi:hypothetical protein